MAFHAPAGAPGATCRAWSWLSRWLSDTTSTSSGKRLGGRLKDRLAYRRIHDCYRIAMPTLWEPTVSGFSGVDLGYENREHDRIWDTELPSK
jgi:hypothetical protein